VTMKNCQGKFPEEFWQNSEFPWEHPRLHA